jgi:S1-C subfamily serine protease
MRSCMQPCRRGAIAVAVQGTLAALVVILSGPALARMPEFATGNAPTLAPLVREITPSVVNISVRGRVKEENPLYRDPLFREFYDVPKQLEREVQATGSGVIVDSQRGYVLTANHVVEKISSAQVTTKDGRRFAAKLVGRDPGTDIAVLQLQSANGLKALAIGDRDKLQVGDFVLAVGNPLGLGQTVTSGIVSALGRTGIGKQGYKDFIQTDAPENETPRVHRASRQCGGVLVAIAALIHQCGRSTASTVVIPAIIEPAIAIAAGMPRGSSRLTTAAMNIAATGSAITK